jgi:hypothetical protein
MRRLALAFLILLACPGAALADAQITAFTVEPSNLQAGGHPDVKLTQEITYSGADDVKDTFTRLAPGLLGNPQNAAFCTSAQLRTPAGCPDDARVGSVRVTARVGPLYLPPDLAVSGIVYNLKPTGGEPARLGLELDAAGNKTYLEAPVHLRPGADGIGLETLFADQPRDAGGLDIQIRKVELTFDGQASKGSFMRMPTSCAPAGSLARINSWEAPTVFTQVAHSFTPTGCDKLAFAPKAEGKLGAPGETADGDFPPLETTLRFNSEHAALNRAEVTLPVSLAPNQAGLNRACLREQANATACPASSRVGTAIIDSPLQAAPVRGPVYLALNNPSPLPGLIVVLPPPVDLRIDAIVETGAFGVRNTFPTNPDLPLNSFTLQFDGGPTGVLQLTEDLCEEGTPTAITGKLTAWNGAVHEFTQDLATPGCDPRARVTVNKRRGRYTLVAVLQAARRGPGITAAQVKLPKGLVRGKRRPRAVADGKKLRARAKRKAVGVKIGGDGARRVKIVWRGLKARRKLRATLKVPVSMVDERGKRTGVRKSVPRP